jgi:hypothetical protein
VTYEELFPSCERCFFEFFCINPHLQLITFLSEKQQPQLSCENTKIFGMGNATTDSSACICKEVKKGISDS